MDSKKEECTWKGFVEKAVYSYQTEKEIREEVIYASRKGRKQGFMTEAGLIFGYRRGW